MELTKGTTLDLNKQAAKTLAKIRLGAGWDVAPGKSVDLDLWLIPKGGTPCCYANKSIAGAVLDGDDRSGGVSKDGADENITIDVAALTSPEYTVVVNIYDAVKKGQFFKDVSRAFVEVVDMDGGAKVFNYNISENGGDNSCLVAGKLVKGANGLDFTGTSQFSTKSIEAVVAEVGGTL